LNLGGEHGQGEGKTCSKCGRELPATAGYFNKNRKGLRGECKACQAEYRCAYRLANRGKEREDKLRANYGLTPGDYDRLLALQGGRCASCGKTPGEVGAAFLAVDHCHRTGRVRGLLCKRCNIDQGRVEKDARRMLVVGAYTAAHALIGFIADHLAGRLQRSA
jgi:hypothetical protein